MAFAVRGELSPRDLTNYLTAQCVGAVLGVWAAHLMFDLSVLQVSQTVHRTGIAQSLSEIIATFGLLFVIYGRLRARAEAVPMLVAIYITGAYWFTSSTSFANPAVTLTRGFSDTFAGIYPGHIPAFIQAQLIAAGLAHVVLRWLSDE